uniref:homeodomain-interacting protein kinase 4-like n=1 Tax=Styela clava TaxID=7725 RepID=UPI00193A1BC5|nr:homeodomain-interacting protein kinase 4-like [Styela clava]
MQSSYNIISHVGSGTFGKVFKCKHVSSGRLVAIKELVRDKFREQVLLNEVDILKKLTRNGIQENNFIMQTLDIIEEPSRTCLVFELLDKSLYQLMKERKFLPLPFYDIRIIAYQLFSALQRLFELNLLHTDIKPENIMLVDHRKWPFRVKIIDFGSASRLSTARIYHAPYIQSRFYRSPEILIGSSFSEAIDMWSVGCVLAEICIGHPLYPGTSEYDQIRYIEDMQGDFPCNILKNGRKTEKYFIRVHHPKCEKQFMCKPNTLRDESNYSACNCPWRRKNIFEYKNETGKDPAETRKLKFSSLSHLAQWRRYHTNQTTPTYNDSIQHCDSLMFANLLEKILALDSSRRIKPCQALFHEFVTATHLSWYDTRAEYIKNTDESSLKAFGIPWIIRNYSPATSFYNPFWGMLGQSLQCNFWPGTQTKSHTSITNELTTAAMSGHENAHGPSGMQSYSMKINQTTGCPRVIGDSRYTAETNQVNTNAGGLGPDGTIAEQERTVMNHSDASNNTVYFPSSTIQHVNHPSDNMYNFYAPYDGFQAIRANPSGPPETYDSAILFSLPQNDEPNQICYDKTAATHKQAPIGTKKCRTVIKNSDERFQNQHTSSIAQQSRNIDFTLSSTVHDVNKVFDQCRVPYPEGYYEDKQYERSVEAVTTPLSVACSQDVAAYLQLQKYPGTGH